MKRVIAALVVLVAAGLIVWRCSGNTASRSKATPGSAIAAGSQRAGKTPAAWPAERAMPAWFAPKHVPAKRIAGHVTLNGKPVAGATVALQHDLTRAGAMKPLETKSDASGAFDFGMQPPGRFAVIASTPSTVAAIVHVDLSDPKLDPPPDRLELKLRDCTYSIAGTVYDAAGNGLPKVHVERDGFIGTTTDDTGAYKLCVPFGDVTLEYGADGYGTVLLTTDVRGDMVRDVVLVPEATVVVKVVRGETDEPVPEAFVMLFPKQWGPDRPQAMTGISDAEGKVRLTGLVPGRYRVNGHADGLTTQGATVEVLAEVGAAAEVTLRLAATSRITGKVMNAGKPVVGAQVAAVRKSPAWRSAPGYSVADGSFVLENVPPGEVVFVAPPYDVQSPAHFTAKAGESHEVTIEVRPLGAIRGRVTRNGTPTEGVDVCCIQLPNAWGPPTRKTDAAGKYEFVGVPAGEYPLNAGSDELGAFSMGGKVTLAAGEEKTFDMEMDMAGTIAGTVVDGSGKPIAGVYVRWMHEKTGDQGRAMTNAKGEYRCGAMTGGGKYKAAVFASASQQQVPYPTANGAAYPEVEVKDGKTVIEGITIAIERPDLVIAGRVVDDRGKPVADAIVKALPAPNGPPQFHSWIRAAMSSTNDDGTFTIANLAPGNYGLSARAGDGSEGTVSPIAAGKRDVTIRIERAGAIEGKLVGFTQPPVVYASTVGAFNLISGTVEGQAFRVVGLRPGRYLVNAQTTWEGDAQHVDIKAGETVKLTLTSKGKGTIEGVVLDFRTRKPIPNAACHVVMSVDGEQALTNWDLATAPKSDANGRVRFDPAPAGSVDVNCQMASFRWSQPSANVTLAAGSTANVELLTVELTTENPGSTGMDFDWRLTPPRVSGVSPNSPAAKAGVLPGDLVVAVDDRPVTGLNSAGVARLIASTEVGNDVKIKLQRGAQTKTVTLKVIVD